MGELVSAIVFGILNGGVYALLAAGLSLIFGVMSIVNFAHGELVMLGMFGSFWAFRLLGIDPYVSLLLVAPVMFFLGMAIQLGLINRVSLDDHKQQILITLGLSIVLMNLATLLWSPNYRVIAAGYRDVTASLAGIQVSVPRIFAFAGSFVMIGSVYAFLKHTRPGAMIRATAQDRVAAGLMGINVKLIYAVVFGIGTMCAGVAGSLISTHYYIYPRIGSMFIMLTFVIVVFGGMGSIRGALVGGLIIGVVESVSAVFIPPSLKEATYYSIFLLTLWIRPKGIFGGNL
jgi:branched-chain amino acid transport system permease protein